MKRYAVTEIFNTLQGEGARAGTRAVFIRLAGCNLWDGTNEGRLRGRGACSRWCDTDFAPRFQATALEIVEKAKNLWPEAGERWVVITGGEPSLQLDVELVVALQQEGFHIAVETNGTSDKTALHVVDWLTCSPKRGAPLALTRCDELKVVLDAEEPWGLDDLGRFVTLLRPKARYVQPMDGARVEESTRLCVRVALSVPGWALSLQAHKLVGLP